jgi:hypothetical protein
VFYGQRGRIGPRDFAQQMSTCSSLTIILACIIYWQGREMSRIVRRAVRDEGSTLNLSMLAHVSPIERDNVVLYGRYVLNRGRVSQRPD